MKPITFFAFSAFVFLLLSLQACQKDPIEPVDRPAKALSITKIELLAYPIAQPDGSGWDFSTGPDIFLVVSSGSTVSASDQVTSIATNATGAARAFTLSTPKTISTLDNTWSVGAFDADDFDSDDYMGGISFVPSFYQDDLPETILLTVGQMQFRLHVTWNF